MRRICSALLMVIVALGMMFVTHQANGLSTGTPIPTQQASFQIRTIQSTKGALFWDVVWTPDFSQLAVASCKKLFIYDPTGQKILSEHAYSGNNCLYHLAFGAVNTIAFTTTDSTVEVWDTAFREKKAEAEAPNGGPASAIAFDLDKGLLLVANAGEVLSWDTTSYSSKEPLTIIQPHYPGAYTVGFSVDASLVAVETPKDKPDAPEYSVNLWDLHTGKVLSRLNTQTEIARSLAFSPNNLLLAVGTENGIIQLWDIQKTVLSSSLTTGRGIVTSLRFSPDSKSLASATIASGTIQIAIWDVETKTQVASFLVESVYSPALAFNQAGDTLIVGTDNDLQFWKYK